MGLDRQLANEEIRQRTILARLTPRAIHDLVLRSTGNNNLAQVEEAKATFRELDYTKQFK